MTFIKEKDVWRNLCIIDEGGNTPWILNLFEKFAGFNILGGKKIVKTVEKTLKIDEILKDGAKFEFNSLIAKRKTNLIDFLSIKLGFSLNILCPPVKECILCQRNLSINNRPTQVVVYKLTGPEIYSKYIYRCKSCSLVKKIQREGFR